MAADYPTAPFFRNGCMLHHVQMSAFLLLLMPPSDARAAAVRRARDWSQANGQRLGGPATVDPCRQYEYPEASLLVWRGHGPFAQQIDAEQVQMHLSSQALAAADTMASSHALRLSRNAVGEWALDRGWHAERNVYLRSAPGTFAAASSPRLLLAALAQPVSEEPAAIAAFFAHRPLAPPMCFFEGVRCLSPGSGVNADPTGTYRVKNPTALTVAPLGARTDADWLQAFDTALRRSLQDLPDQGQIGLMLSGGIDSSTLAAGLAAVNRPATLFTWQLPLASADESALAATTATALRLPLATVPVPTLPFGDLTALPINPDAPLANPYRALNDALMQAATSAGVTTLLSGNFGDHLYPEPQLALTSAWRAARYGLAASAGWHKVLGRLARGPWWPRSWQAPARPANSLTAHAQALLDSTVPPEIPAYPVEDPTRLPDLFGTAPRLDAEGAWYFASAYPLELRFPYRHQALLDLALQWPVHLSERHGQRKWLTRQWLAGKLPDTIRLRPKAGSLAPWFWRGLEAHREAVQARLTAPNARWMRYLRAEAVLASLNQAGSEASGLHVWQALCYEIWHETAIHDGTLR